MASAPVSAIPQFDNTLGALLIGGLVATALWGVTCVQTFTFFMGDTTDRAWHKALVAFLLCLDTFDTFLNCHILYFYLVTNYLAPQAIFSPVWSVIIHVAATSVSNFIVRRQVFPLASDMPLTSSSAFARRVYRLSNGNIPGTVWIVTLSLLDLSCGLAITVKAYYRPLPLFVVLTIVCSRFSMKSYQELDSLSSLMYLNFAAGTSSDLSVALALCYLLRGSRTGFQRTDSLIRVLMMYTVNTGLIVALDATAGMFSYVFMPHNFIFLGFYLLLSKLYLNSYLALLNARKGLRGQLDEPKSIHLSRIHSTMRWRNGVVYDPEDQRSNSQPALAVSKSDGATLDASLGENRAVEKHKEYVEPSGFARAY
ncbi:hypothetical protein DFH09DRAFT_1262455 [Mycena vulgaris]|nr:hypothetical protein DFH09DRAFT_1262455 [Mycena vulgaris]